MDIAPYSDAIAGIANLGGKIIDRLFPDPVAAASAKLELIKMQETGELARLAADTDLMKGQIAVDNTEAASESFWKSGWRPGVGWLCVGALALQLVIGPAVVWGFLCFGHVLILPPLDTGTIIALLGSLLGIGGMRTAEKINGVTK